MAYFRFLASILAVTSPMREASVMSQRQLEHGAEGQRELEQEVDVVLRS